MHFSDGLGTPIVFFRKHVETDEGAFPHTLERCGIYTVCQYLAVTGASGRTLLGGVLASSACFGLHVEL